ncbi:hypothetical protein IWQ61_003871 [Dispira simplex]|nr:hypothetical protein IWQ61_003871 [Dispira simplex]
MALIPDPVRDLMAGTVGGWAQVVVGHPFDTVKVRLQTQSDPARFRNGIHCTQLTLKEEGARGLYKGVTSPLAGIGICNAVVFSANGYFRRLLQSSNPDRPLTLSQLSLAGSMAGGVMAFFNCPIELLKVKLQVQYGNGSGATSTERPYRGVFDCGVRTFRAQGFSGLYRGIGITILRDVPSFAFYFGTYEGIKKLFLRSRSMDVATPMMPAEPSTISPVVPNPTELTNTGFELFLAGGLAGIAAWIPCFPQDVVKSRMQSSNKFRTTSECVKALVQEVRLGSLRTLFKGFGPTLARAFPANAATFVAYEWAMKVLP